MKKLISIILTLAMLLSMTTVMADEEIKVYVDGEQVVFDAQPFIENDRTLVPMRAIFEKLGAEVTWDDNTKTVTAKKENCAIHITVGSENMEKEIIYDWTGVEIHPAVYSSTEIIAIDVPAQIIKDRTYIPLRAVFEAFDCDVQWDGKTKTVNIISEKTYSILENRLTVGDIKGWRASDGFSGFDTWVEYSRDKSFVVMTAKELGYKATDDLLTDVKNLGYTPVGETVSQNGIEYAEFATDNAEESYLRKYIVKSHDGYLIYIYFRSDIEKISEQDFITASTEIMKTLDAGTKNINISAGTVNLYDIIVDQPEGYLSYLEYTAEFDVYRIQKVVTPDADVVPRILICGSPEMSYNEEYNGKKAIKTIKGEFLGNKITWNIYKEDNYMQALYHCEEEGYYYHLYAYAENAEQQQEFVDIVSKIKENTTAGVGAKPVIYLYPEQEQEVNVKLDLNGEFTFTYPEYNNGWTVTAKPDGTIISDGEEYSYLFWEGEMPTFKPDFKEGFVVKGSDSAQFLRETLEKMGLTHREYNEFIVYWAPKLQENEYNKIYFAQEEYEECAKLEITPKPDSILRVFMVYEEADADTVLPEQEIKPFEREGFTVVEWGGYLAE